MHIAMYIQHVRLRGRSSLGNCTSRPFLPPKIAYNSTVRLALVFWRDDGAGARAVQLLIRDIGRAIDGRLSVVAVVGRA